MVSQKIRPPSFLLLLKMVDKSWLENMTLFEFLNKLDSENIKYEIDYNCSSWISVKIIMRDKYWLVSFDESGFLDLEVYKVECESRSENIQEIFQLFNAARKLCIGFYEKNGIDFNYPFVFKNKEGITREIEGIFPDFGRYGVIVTSNNNGENAI
ncbi:hypothetical protein [Vibrio harveyi]|uniref:hypothetical protein n=1 Tax=Vibrio harveyi TaxID=669 RepID=UPI00237FD9D9|nr:hypothetical protein [Vibrio harveyi]